MSQQSNRSDDTGGFIFGTNSQGFTTNLSSTTSTTSFHSPFFSSGNSNASSPMPLQFAGSPGLNGFGINSLQFSGSPGLSGFPTTNNNSLFPTTQFPQGWSSPGNSGGFGGGGGNLSLPQSPTPFFLAPNAIDAAAAAMANSQHQHHQQQFDHNHAGHNHNHHHASSVASPPFTSLADPYASVGLGAGLMSPGLGGLSGDDNNLARDMSFSAEVDGGTLFGDSAGDQNPLDSTDNSWIEDDTAAVSMAHSTAMDQHQQHYQHQDGPAADVGQEDDDQEEKDVEMYSSKKRKLGEFKPPQRISEPTIVVAPANARVCELGLLHRQVTGVLCWTSYQKVSATDRSCQALLCSTHSDEMGPAANGVKYTQYVQQELLLQIGLTIEKKPLEKAILALQSQGLCEPVLVMRIRRAVPGRVKTGPDYVQLLLFPSIKSKEAAEATLDTHVLPVAARVVFPAALVPFTCDFTKRCVWLVPKQLCVGGQYMIPASAGQLAKGPDPTALVPAGNTQASANVHMLHHTPDTPSGHSVISHHPSIGTSAAGSSSTQLPLFSALSLHAPPGLEDATFVRVIRTLKQSHQIFSLTPAEDPYSQLQLAFNDLERVAVEKFKRFPGREAVFQDELTVDLFITRQTFLQYALEHLFDFTWANESERQQDQLKWAPVLHSLFLLISLPSVGMQASRMTFTQFFRLYSFLRPESGWLKPGCTAFDGEENGWTAEDLHPSVQGSGRSRKQDYVISQLFKLLTFLHRSLKFFQSYIRTNAKKFVFATRAALEQDERFQKFTSSSSSQSPSGSTKFVKQESSNMVDSVPSSAADGSEMQNLQFIPQIRFCEGHIGHVSSDSQEPLFRDIVLSYTWCDPSDGIPRKMEHIPLLRDGPEGYFVFNGNDPQVSLNFLTPQPNGDETALIEFTRRAHIQLMQSRESAMEGSERPNEYSARTGSSTTAPTSLQA